jgi:hypothetical protein
VGCDSSAKEGKFEILKLGVDSGYELNTILDKDTMLNVAFNGHLEVVKYLRTVGIEWDSDTCAYAAMNGHLELLKWARVKKCPWNASTCSMAALNGHLNLLKWARTNKCPWNEWKTDGGQYWW